VAFNIFTFLSTLLGGLDVPDLETKVVAWLENEAAKFPDLTARIKALEEWITAELEAVIPQLVLSTMKNTIFGIATDIIHGTATVDPGAWKGMV